MEAFLSRINDEALLNIFRTIYIVALVITVVATIFVNVFATRATDKMKREIAQSNETAAKSNQLAAEANQRTEELKNENLNLGLRLEQERLARLEIERRLAPRFLTEREKTVISEAIRPFAKHKIQISRPSDPEAGPYGQQITELFKAAGWEVEVHYENMLGPVYGLIFTISSNPDAAVKTVLVVFSKVGAKPTVHQSQTFSADRISLIVGLKHPQAQ